MKLDPKLVRTFNEAGFDVNLVNGNACFFVEISIYTPEREEWTEMLFAGEATYAEIADSVSDYADSFNIETEFTARKDNVASGNGYPATEREQYDDLIWLKNKLEELDEALIPYSENTKSAIMRNKVMER